MSDIFAGWHVPEVGLTGSPLDRADHLRRDPAAMIALRSRPDARWLVMDDLRPVLTGGERPDILWAWRSDVPHDATSVFLGLDGEAPRFAAAASGSDLVGDSGGQIIDARAAAPLLPSAPAPSVATPSASTSGSDTNDNSDADAAAAAAAADRRSHARR